MLHQSDFQKNIDHEQHRKLKITNPIVSRHKCKLEICVDSLTTAYCEVAPKKHADQIGRNDNKLTRTTNR